MQHPSQELIWRGRVHIGDEPGILGDAQYVGLGVDLPITIRPFTAEGDDDGRLIIGAEGVRVYDGYAGHRVAIVSYTETSDPARWREQVLAEERMTQDRLSMRLRLSSLGLMPGAPLYLSVRVRIDTQVPPGLYDDFELVQLQLTSGRYYASFGFQR